MPEKIIKPPSEPEEPDHDDQSLGRTVLERLQATGCYLLAANIVIIVGTVTIKIDTSIFF